MCSGWCRPGFVAADLLPSGARARIRRPLAGPYPPMRTPTVDTGSLTRRARRRRQGTPKTALFEPFAPGVYVWGAPGDVARQAFGARRTEAGDKALGNVEEMEVRDSFPFHHHEHYDFCVSTAALADQPVRRMECGARQVTLLTDDGELWCFGSGTAAAGPNVRGPPQPPAPAAAPQPAHPRGTTAAQAPCPRRRLAAQGQDGCALPELPPPTPLQLLTALARASPPVVDVACGEEHTAALVAAKGGRPTVYQWDSNGICRAVRGVASPMASLAARGKATVAAGMAGELVAWRDQGGGRPGAARELPTTEEGMAALAGPFGGDRAVEEWRGLADGVGSALDWSGPATVANGSGSGGSVPHAFNAGARGIVQVACGLRHVAVLTRAGEVWTWGARTYGLGHAAAAEGVRVPRQVEAAWGGRVSHIAAGARHCVAVTAAGSLFAWGDNSQGQAGCGDLTEHPVLGVAPRARQAEPVRLALPPVREAACGDAHTVALTRAGEVYHWGYLAGECVPAPRRRDELLDYQVCRIACGPTFAAALLAPPGLFLRATEVPADGRVDDEVLFADMARAGRPQSAPGGEAGKERPATVVVPCKFAEFGRNGQVPAKPLRLLAADPITAPGRLRNAREAKGAMVLVERGATAFAGKAGAVAAAGAAGVVFVNNDRENPQFNVRVTGEAPDAGPLFAVSTSAESGDQLRALLSAASGPVAVKLQWMMHARDGEVMHTAAPEADDSVSAEDMVANDVATLLGAGEEEGGGDSRPTVEERLAAHGVPESDSDADDVI